MSYLEKPAAIDVRPIGYRAKCGEQCGNLARAIVREVDNGGRPLGQFERCLLHTREAIERAERSGVKVHDLRMMI